jgi:hypothetical protein
VVLDLNIQDKAGKIIDSTEEYCQNLENNLTLGSDGTLIVTKKMTQNKFEKGVTDFFTKNRLGE